MAKRFHLPWRALVLGLIGLISGYWGPLYFNSASQGPLLGVLFTGPTAFLLGLGLDWLYARRRVPVVLREGLFIISMAAVAAASLVLSQPGDRLIGSLEDGEIVGCESAATRIPEAIRKWEKTLSSTPQWHPWPGWKEEMQRRLVQHPSVVLALKVYRARSVYEAYSRSEHIPLRADDWVRQGYIVSEFAEYAGGDCAHYELRKRGLFWNEVTRSTTDKIPPDDLPTFLYLGSPLERTLPSTITRFAQ